MWVSSPGDLSGSAITVIMHTSMLNEKLRQLHCLILACARNQTRLLHVIVKAHDLSIARLPGSRNYEYFRHVLISFRCCVVLTTDPDRAHSTDRTESMSSQRRLGSGEVAQCFGTSITIGPGPDVSTWQSACVEQRVGGNHPNGL